MSTELKSFMYSCMRALKCTLSVLVKKVHSTLTVAGNTCLNFNHYPCYKIENSPSPKIYLINCQTLYEMSVSISQAFIFPEMIRITRSNVVFSSCWSEYEDYFFSFSELKTNLSPDILVDIGWLSWTSTFFLVVALIDIKQWLLQEYPLWLLFTT